MTGGTSEPISQLLEEVRRSRSMFFDGGGVTLTGGEATVQFEAVFTFLEALKTMGVNTCMETNGACGRLDDLLPLLDWLIIDVKHYDPQRLRAVTGANHDQVKRNIRVALAKAQPLALRIPLIGGFNASREDAQGFVRLLDEFGVNEQATLELLPYHEYGKSKYARMGLPYTMGAEAKISPQTLRTITEVFRDAGYKLIRT